MIQRFREFVKESWLHNELNYEENLQMIENIYKECAKRGETVRKNYIDMWIKEYAKKDLLKRGNLDEMVNSFLEYWKSID